MRRQTYEDESVITFIEERICNKVDSGICVYNYNLLKLVFQCRCVSASRCYTINLRDTNIKYLIIFIIRIPKGK
jgi:hypothetical protein